MKDNLDLKLSLFHERCDQADLPRDYRHKAFSSMLSGAALNYFLTVVKSTSTNLQEMVSMVRNRFVTSESTLALTREWDNMSLRDYAKKYPDKSLRDSLDLMVKRLQELQLCLPRPYQNDEMLKHRLLNACDGFEECKFARQKVSPTVMGVIADLQNSIATHISGSKSNDSNDVFVIDRHQRFAKRCRGRPGLNCRVCGKDVVGQRTTP